MLSIPLASVDRVVGALNLYSRVPNAFDARAEEAAQSLVDYAAEVLATSALYAYALELVDGLVESLESQAIIAQATGVLAATEQLKTEEALDRLRTLALASGESMRRIAAWVIEERPSGAVNASPDRLPGVDMTE